MILWLPVWCAVAVLTSALVGSLIRRGTTDTAGSGAPTIVAEWHGKDTWITTTRDETIFIGGQRDGERWEHADCDLETVLYRHEAAINLVRSGA